MATLPNGIVLPAVWPPTTRPLDNSVITPPYLSSPPNPIILNKGERQLFVDDFLIESTTMTRTYYQGTQYSGNPVIDTTKPWENDFYAMAFSHAIVPEPNGTPDYHGSVQYRMYYGNKFFTGLGKGMCLAVSRDGKNWGKPTFSANGEVTTFPGLELCDSVYIWFDPDSNPRYVMSVSNALLASPLSLRPSVWTSNDGINWTMLFSSTSIWGDRSTIWYNPWRKKWVYSIRDITALPVGRFRRYWEVDNLTDQIWSSLSDPVVWWCADDNDPLYPGSPMTKCQLYNLDVKLYESVFIGLFSIMSADSGQINPQRTKINQVFMGSSRDGFYFDRTSRIPVCSVTDNPPSPNAPWNWGNVQSVGGCPMISPDGTEIWLYSSGRKDSNAGSSIGSIGLWTLRRDGWCSLDSGGSTGITTTRPVRISGESLFVNCNNFSTGGLQAQIVDESGALIPGFSTSEFIKGDNLSIQVKWPGRGNGRLGSLVGRSVKVKFLSTNTRLYSFWFQ